MQMENKDLSKKTELGVCGSRPPSAHQWLDK